MSIAPVIVLSCAILCAAVTANAQAATKCFSADWLQGRRVVNLSVNGDKVTGTFVVEGEDAVTYEFSGTLRGDKLAVAFAGGVLPDLAPSEMSGTDWTLAREGGREVLRIRVRGRNYETNRYEDHTADLLPCGAEDYDALAKRARVVRFARGSDSARLGLASLTEFQAMRAPAAFLVGAARSQSLEITAEGCVIQVYLPGGRLYEYVEWEGAGEKTLATSKVDRLVIESLPLTGNYLVVLRKAAENTRPAAVTFKATGRGR